MIVDELVPHLSWITKAQKQLKIIAKGQTSLWCNERTSWSDLSVFWASKSPTGLGFRGELERIIFFPQLVLARIVYV